MKLKLVASSLLLCLLVMPLSGCSTAKLSMSEEADWGALLNQKAVSKAIPFKSTKAACIWDIVLPGVGSTYAGGGDSWGWIVGGFAVWPISAFYQHAIGRAIARNVSKRRTIEYYKFGSHLDKIQELKSKGKLPVDFKTKEEAKVAF